MRLTWVAVVCALGGMQFVNCASAAHAQDATGRSRRLKGHVFLFPLLQDSAFVTTYAGIREGFAQYDVPDLPVGELGTRDITLSGVRQSLDLGLGLTQWLGLFAIGRAVVVTGTDRTSLLVDGASVEFHAYGGLVVRLLRNEGTGTQVSFRARAGYWSGREVSVQPLVRALVDDVPDTLVDVINRRIGQLIFVPTSETSVTGGVHAAQYLTPYLSAQASVAFEKAWQEREPFILNLDRRLAD